MTVRLKRIPAGIDPALAEYLKSVGEIIEAWQGLRGAGERAVGAGELMGDWQNPVLLDGWTRYAETHEAPAFCRAADGLVVLKGTVAGGTVGATARVFMLPAGFRPAYKQVFAAITNTGIGQVDVEPTGEVRPVTGGTTWFSVNAVFRSA